MNARLNLTSLPSLGAALAGGIYAALLSEAKTGRPYMLVINGKVGEDKEWQQAIDLVPEGQSLPNKVEGMALQSAGLIDEDIWLSEPYGARNAWVQYSYGSQDVYSRNYEFSAVSVSRLFLDSFDASEA